MSISFERLPSRQKGWRNGKHWLEEITAWSEAYQNRHMVPAESNKRIGDANINVLLSNVLRALRSYGEVVISTIIEP